MRHLAAVALLAVLAGCGTEKSSGDTPNGEVVSENLDKDELSEELVTALISEKVTGDNCYDLQINQRNLFVESPEKTRVKYVPGREPLPQIFHLYDTSSLHHKFDGFSALLDAGVLTAEHIRDYEEKQEAKYLDVKPTKFTVYKIGFSEAAIKSNALRINEHQSLSNDGQTIASICLGQKKVSDVKYVIPNEASFSSATFSWHIAVTDPFAQSFLGVGYWGSPPAISGTGTASFAKTNVGWEVTNVEVGQ